MEGGPEAATNFAKFSRIVRFTILRPALANLEVGLRNLEFLDLRLQRRWRDAQPGRSTIRALKAGLASVAFLTALNGTTFWAQTQPVKNIVLVHGVWVDGSGWKLIYDILVKGAYHVSVVQEPLTSFLEDVAATKHILAEPALQPDAASPYRPRRPQTRRHWPQDGILNLTVTQTVR